MDLNFTPQEEAFRAEVRAFLAEKLPARLSDKVAEGKHLSKADMEEWHAILNERGWLANHWPEEYGGPGWTAIEKFIFENESAIAHAPRIVPFGVNMLGPVLIKYGNAAQKAYWLPRILNGDDWWCQGYSEPGAGSDLAAVKTTAVRGTDAGGEHYIVNGQKTWTTLGQHANMIFCLVRTDREAKKQSGISFLLVDMNSPGVEVRPIITLDGEHEVNEVFFTDVRVPVENLVGEENAGWTCAKYLLTYERTNIAGVGFSVAALARLKRVAARQTRNGRPLSEDPRHRDPPGDHLADPARDGRACAPLQPGHARRRLPGSAGRPRFRRGRLGAVFQQPQAVDLRRLQRDPEEHHLEDDPGPVRTTR
jgi:alkylation response protein AidB-like acyl-CoA dehydrogenase